MFTINGSPILLSRPFPKRPGMLSGSVILVDCGGEYVVALLCNDETTGKPRNEWANGEYFNHQGYEATIDPVKKTKALHLAKTAYEKKCERNC